MGKVTGFLEIDRQDRKYRTASDRIRNYHEFVIPLSDSALKDQAARCMDCGIPYCHSGCPVSNQIPDWNDLVYNDNWREALINLHSTNNFPEFTGRVCPAPCEASCTLNITDEPVTIKSVECAIVDRGWLEGWIEPEISLVKTGKKIAVIGAGPAGMACAQQLARVGHEVHLYEKNAKAGGLLRYGIPDFKMEKHIIDRRVEQMEAEGVEFHYNSDVGGEVSFDEISKSHDAMVITIGAEKPRDLPIEGRDLDGIHFAMDFLPQQNRRVGGENLGNVGPILASGKHVVVIGGGDTGSDCIGTSVRQGALSVTQLEIMEKPPKHEDKMMTWPDWPMKLRTSSSHEEGAKREFAVTTLKFEGKNGAVKSLECARVDENFKPVEGSQFKLKADLVFFAMGFVSPVHEGLLEKLGVKLDSRENVAATMDDFKTSVDDVYSAGDCRRGQSLVVWAITEGRQAARSVDKILMGSSNLPK
ncbi:MAG: glutamate synthase subunit beta [Rhizobiaceae bacterium]|nr:glutamate synthase subunit beta [Rhizobiaceae bacterium]